MAKPATPKHAGASEPVNVVGPPRPGPAMVTVTVARKPFKGTVAATVLEHGTGALNIDGCRIGGGTGEPAEPSISNFRNNVHGRGMGGGKWNHSQGRWPANLIFEHRDDCVRHTTGIWRCAEGCPAAAIGTAAAFFHSVGGRSTPPAEPAKVAELRDALCLLFAVIPGSGVSISFTERGGKVKYGASLEGPEIVVTRRRLEVAAVATNIGLTAAVMRLPEAIKTSRKRV